MANDLAITVPLEPIPPTGNACLVPRMLAVDRNLVTDAALTLGMTQAQFMRAILINGAKQVLQMHGVETGDTGNKSAGR